MNGMMVPLLILMMTGTVVGQHFGDSSQFRTQSSPTSHSTGNQGNFSPAAKVQPSQLAPFELSVSNEDIQGLKRTGAVLSSKIEPRDPSTGRILSPEVINGISLVHKNNLNRELPEREIKAENAGNGLIRFGLNDHDLLNLQNNKLSFSFDAADRGRFNAVQFYYKKPAQQSNFVRPSEDTGLPNFSPANSRPSFAKTPSHNDLLPLLPPPGPEELPGGIAFEGPVRPLSIPNSQPQRDFGFASTQPSPWSPEKRPESNPAINKSSFKLPPDRENQFPSRPGSQFNSDSESLLARTQRLEREKQEREKQEQQQQWQRAEQDRLARLAQQSQQPPYGHAETPGWRDPQPRSTFTPQPTRSTPTTDLSFEQQVAQRVSEIEQQKRINQYENELSARTQLIAEREAQLDKERRDMDYERYMNGLRTQPTRSAQSDYVRPTGPVAGNHYPSGPVIDPPERIASRNTRSFLGSGYANNAYGNSSQDRIANNTTPLPPRGIKDFAASVPGVAGNINGINPARLNNQENFSKNEQDKRTQGFVYFMLLCSLGLNIYLGWISRGFYVRYHELADELRETFTATL